MMASMKYIKILSEPRVSRAIEDVATGLLNWRIWLMLSYQDIKLRYRRSKLGPFWITLSMAITVYSMGFLYAHLFKINLESYYPFLTAGMLSWTLISTIMIDLSETFIESGGSIKQIKLPYTVYIHRVVMRNILIFLHNIIVYIPIIILFHSVAKVNLHTLMLLPNLLLIYANAFFYGLVISIICSRYPDMIQIVKSLVQIIFFMTPILWNPSVLPPKFAFFVNLNPFYCFVELIRAPLMGMSIPPLQWIVLIGSTLIGIIFSSYLFIKYRARIVYWI